MTKKTLMPALGAALFFSTLSTAAQAQQVRPALTGNVEGTFTATTNGVELRAAFKFQSPASLRIDLQPHPGALAGEQTVLATGDQTLILDPQTRRVRRLPFNIVKQPWRETGLGWAGTAHHIALFGLDPAQVAAAYHHKAGENSLTLEARPEAGRLVRDYVRSGGDRQTLFYAAFKRRVWDFPQRLRVSLKNNAVAGLSEMDGEGREISTVSLEYSAASLPQKSTVRDAGNRLVGEIRYDLRARAENFGPETFSGGPIQQDAITEEAELDTLASYSGRTDADSLYNRGIAVVRHTEEYATALRLWNEAATRSPRATAPHFATYQAALSTRNLPLAAAALERLEQLLGAGNLSVLNGRAHLAALRRDWPEALAALENAQKAAPHDLGVTLLRSRILRGQGRLSEARALLLEIVNSDLPQPATQTAAAEELAATAWGAAESDELLATIPGDTQWQKLARLHLALWRGETVEPQGLTEPLALASLAAAYEREKYDDAAIRLWQNIADSSHEAAIVAAQHLILLGARRGDAALSLRNFRALVAAANDEATRQREAGFLREGWRKNFRQDDLRAALQSRAISAGATEPDLETWLAWLEAEGSRDDIGAAVRAAVAGFDSSALWHSRYAEQLLIERSALKADQERGRANLLREAQQEIERAIELDPGQPYYAMQLALTALQRYGEKSSIINVNEEAEKRDNAVAALDRLERAWPRDMDVALLVALGRKALAHGSAESISPIAEALQSGHPGRETLTGEQHSTAFFARQAIAMAWRRLKRWPEAEREYQALLLASQSANEQLGLGINYIAMLGEKAGKGKAPELEPIALLLERAVSEPWPYADSQTILQNYISLLLPNRPVAAELAALLLKGNAARQVAAAQLLYETERLAARDAEAPDAPPATERILRQTQALSTAATEALQQIAQGADKLAASRALSLLAQRSLQRGNAALAVGHLDAAILLEPQEVALRVALVRAHSLAGQQAEAEKARNDLLRTLPRDGETLRQAAQITQFIGQDQEALRLAAMAQQSLQTARTPSPAQVQSASFILARALFDVDKKDDAAKLYRQLAGPQWTVTERAAALLDWEARLLTAGDDTEAAAVRRSLDDLKARPAELQQARALLEDFD